MNPSLNREQFNTLGEREIASFIEQARDLIILVIPSMTNMIVESLLKSSVSKKQIIISKIDSTNNRTLEHAASIKILLDNNILLRVSESFSLGAFIMDDRGWIFTPEALTIKNINCLSVSDVEVQKLVSGLSAIIVERHVDGKNKPELGEKILTQQELIQIIEEEKKVIEEKIEIEKLQNLDIEFVELEFKGLRLASKKIPIPQELTTLGMEKEVKEILSSTAKIFSGKHDFAKELKSLEDKRNQLNKDFLIIIKDYGSIIRKYMKKPFNAALIEINNEKEAVKNKIQASLAEELEKTKQALIDYYFPIVRATPPSFLQKVNKTINDSVISNYLSNLFDKSMPNVQTLVDEIELTSHFKGLTGELMSDKKFLEALKNKGIEL